MSEFKISLLESLEEFKNIRTEKSHYFSVGMWMRYIKQNVSSFLKEDPSSFL